MSGWKTEYVPGKPRLAYDRMGRGPLLFFLHGIGGSRSNWHLQLPAFATDFTAISWDARGYGLSEDYDGPLDFADFSADVVRVLDHLGADKAHLCGLSMGGRIAQDFYPRHPERVATLTLCDTFPGFEGATRAQTPEEFVDSRIKPLLEGKTPMEVAAARVGRLMSPKRSEDAFRRAVESSASIHIESYIKTVRASIAFNRAADLPNIKVPTLLIFGREDPLTPPAIGEVMARHIPDSRLVVLEDAGHMANLEQPAAFNAALRAFLARHRDRAAPLRGGSAGQE
ncbi:MAG: alpha/beta fold hydrolase [Alphaproteobacteria bacterium]|nr:alpha/beta fold hydrolase [Alphaproteobacteria bacterium]